MYTPSEMSIAGVFCTKMPAIRSARYFARACRSLKPTGMNSENAMSHVPIVMNAKPRRKCQNRSGSHSSAVPVQPPGETGGGGEDGTVESSLPRNKLLQKAAKAAQRAHGQRQLVHQRRIEVL